MGDLDRCTYAVSNFYMCYERVRSLISRYRSRKGAFEIAHSRETQRAINSLLKSAAYLNTECDKFVPVEDLAKEADRILGHMDLTKVDWIRADQWARKVRRCVQTECMIMRPPRLAQSMVTDHIYQGEPGDLIVALAARNDQ